MNSKYIIYKQLGFTVNPLFTFDDQKCMVWIKSIDNLYEIMDIGLHVAETASTKHINNGFINLRNLAD
ncbi:MAG: hypothetical protein ORN58_00015 [Sediminibacterium sp.]|nr:hypothetical protein [Sediminibacterium sp.]